MNRLTKILPTLALLVVPLGVGISAPLDAAPPASDRAKPESTRVVLRNATIHVGDGTIIEKGTIEFVDGKITTVTSKHLVTAGDTVSHDLGGKIVTPGLIATDTMLGVIEIELEDSTHDQSRKDPSPIKAGYDPAPAVNADSSLIAIQAIEGVTTAAVAPRGGLISGTVAWIDLLPHDYAGIVAKANVAVAANFGRSYAGSRAASLAQLRAVFEDSDWYRKNERNHDRNQARELVAHPQDLRALWPVLDKQVPLVVRANRASDLLALVELAQSLDIRLTIVGAAEGWKVAEALAEAKIPVVVQPTRNLPGSFDSMGARLDNAKLLHEAGVIVALAEFDTHNVRNITQEAGIAVANGLPQDVALTAVTHNVALAYGMDADYGTIAVGKVASLVVWDGADPFELSTWAERVFVRGQELEMRSRQTELRDRYMDLEKFPD